MAVRTIRESIARRKCIASTVMLLGFASIGGGMFLGVILAKVGAFWLFVAIPGILAFVSGHVNLRYFLCCPNCGDAIGYAVENFGSPFSISSSIRFCPSCGVALDAELKAHRMH